jgi:hypothetical protein
MMLDIFQFRPDISLCPGETSMSVRPRLVPLLVSLFLSGQFARPVARSSHDTVRPQQHVRHSDGWNAVADGARSHRATTAGGGLERAGVRWWRFDSFDRSGSAGFSQQASGRACTGCGVCGIAENTASGAGVSAGTRLDGVIDILRRTPGTWRSNAGFRECRRV